MHGAGTRRVLPLVRRSRSGPGHGPAPPRGHRDVPREALALRWRDVDLDAGTVAALRDYRAARGEVTPDPIRDCALVLSGIDGAHRHPERFSRRFAGQVAQARKALGEEQLPVIRLHDLRHTHATLRRAAGEPVKVASERLGHANAIIRLTVYRHVHPGMGREAADRFADQESATACGFCANAVAWPTPRSSSCPGRWGRASSAQEWGQA